MGSSYSAFTRTSSSGLGHFHFLNPQDSSRCLLTTIVMSRSALLDTIFDGTVILGPFCAQTACIME